MALESVPGYSEFRSGQLGQAYNETAFRYFLAIERRRAERLNRSLLLILVAVREGPGRNATLTDRTAAAVFAGFGACFREVDFVGWYQQGHVAAALLPQGTSVPSDVANLIARRVLLALRARLSRPESENLRVRGIRLGGTSHVHFK
jgi:hypothetical protein